MTGLIFRPTLIPTLVTLLLLVLLLSLGFWQLDRAEQKTRLQQEFQANSKAPAVAVANLDTADPATRYRKVTAGGRYDGRHQVLLDNQVRGGQPGYHVLTPLRLSRNSGDRAILVNRGWVPLGLSRQQLPDVSVGDEEVRIAGRLGQPVNPGLRLQSSDAISWPWVVQSIDYRHVAEMLGYPLYNAIILLDSSEKQGFVRDWKPDFGRFGPERHRGYAVQWFALALTLLIIYIVVNSKRKSD